MNIFGRGPGERDPQAIVRQQHELEESIRIARRMRMVGGIRPVREVEVLGVKRSVPDGPDFLERVNNIADNYTIDGKRTSFTVEEVAEFAAQGPQFDETLAPQSVSMTLEEEARKQHVADFHFLDALFEEAEVTVLEVVDPDK